MTLSKEKGRKRARNGPRQLARKWSIVLLEVYYHCIRDSRLLCVAGRLVYSKE